ncbi:MAG: ParB/RepB/Spo0J family partition protein [Salana multivorans]|nr:ParB/RepB/Spo0J family partition protein [Salana multivorans]OJX95330.1 MAG: chromosome partitioning protein ParB [Micrococcales bacterium 73-15]
MSEKRRTGLGKGLAALIPQTPGASRPVDVFFPEGDTVADERPAAELREAVDTEDGRLADTHREHLDRHDGGASSQVNSRDRNASTDLVAVPARYEEVPLDTVVPNPNQPRTVFDEDDLAELAASIREVGVLQPIVVRPVGETYEIVMGERRWRASQLAGQATVPAIIRETADTDLLRDALLENLHRAQLNPLEEASAYQQLLDDFGCTHEELATRIARSRPQISNTLRLLRLPAGVQRRVAAGVLSAGHARALLGLSDQASMERLAQRIVAEGLSVRATEEIVALGDDEPLRPELRRRRRTGENDAAMQDLGRRLSDRWDTQVKVALGQRKGRIQIDFANLEDLDRILDALAPGEHAAES